MANLTQPVIAGSVSAFVGFASTFALVIQGLVGVGANPVEAASGLMAVSISMGLCAIFLSARYKLPISIAWSTPGAALLASSTLIDGGFSMAVGAFLVSSVLVIISGLWQPLGRLIAAIPLPLAQAMLAGVILPLCIAPFEAAAELPHLGIPVVVVWFLVGRFNKLMAVPAAVFVTAVMIGFTTDLSGLSLQQMWVSPTFTMPTLSLSAVTGIALPIFIVTMASQNIPGIAVLNSFDYRPAPGPLISWTGLFSLISAPFGSLGVNLAAITAALCANEDAHPDRDKRYIAAMTAGLIYVGFGLTAGGAVAFIALAPPLLIKAVAGLALIGTFAASVMGAVEDPGDREAAVITFLITASGLSFLGVSGAFWGLIVGGIVCFVCRRYRAV